MKKIASIVTSTLAAALLLCALPGAADAAVKTIFPEKLRPMASTADYTTSPIITTMNAGTGSFFAPVKLPKGATIDEIKVWTSNGGPPSGAVTVYRVKAGELDIFGANDIAQIDLADATVIWGQLSATPSDPAKAVVRKGYRYFVRATLNNTASIVGAITVKYTK